MNKKERNQLALIQMCYTKQISVPELCKKLKVGKSGLGCRIISLNRKLNKHSE